MTNHASTFKNTNFFKINVMSHSNNQRFKNDCKINDSNLYHKNLSPEKNNNENFNENKRKNVGNEYEDNNMTGNTICSYSNLSPASTSDMEEYKGLMGINNKDDYSSATIKTLDELIPFEDKENLFMGTFMMKKKYSDGDFRVKYKTEICKYWDFKRECQFGDSCAFAHGQSDIRNKFYLTSNYKTKKCKQFFESGYCPYGSRCQFIHNDIRKNSFSQSNSSFYSASKTQVFSYKNIMQSLLDECDLSNQKQEKIFPRQRLKTFRKLNSCNDKDDSCNTDRIETFYDEIKHLKQIIKLQKENFKSKSDKCLDSIFFSTNEPKEM